MTRPLRNQILLGDATHRARALPNASIDCVVTSPPYFRLRDYGNDAQLGLETQIDDWVDGLRQLMVELARVLVPTGTVWLNLGDSYSTHTREGAPRKSLLLGPERLALRLLQDGWILRNKVVWAKTNTIPTSVKDRLATKHEVVYVLARQPRYFFDLDAIRVPHTSPTPKPRRVKRQDDRPPWLGPNADSDRGLDALHAAGNLGHPLGKNPSDVWPLATSRFRGAHFATFPVSLAERMVRAGCPEARCTVCLRPYTRPVRRLGAAASRLGLTPGCRCGHASEPGLVLDPFLGSGTTAVAAENFARDWLGIEIIPAYITLARKRIKAERLKRPGITTNREEVA